MHDVDLQKLPVRFAMDRAGLVGADGPTHCGAFDVTFMACLPNMVVMAPSDEAELFHMVATAAAIDDRPSCFRYPRGNGIGVELPPGNKGKPLEVLLLSVKIIGVIISVRNSPQYMLFILINGITGHKVYNGPKCRPETIIIHSLITLSSSFSPYGMKFMSTLTKMSLNAFFRLGRVVY